MVMALGMAADFDLTRHSIPLEEIRSGGPPVDGIPALTEPATLARKAAAYLRDDDLVIGVVRNGQARAYPIRILNWHEIVNDVLGETFVVVTYCPLCGSGMVFDATMKGARYVFGPSLSPASSLRRTTSR